MSDTHHRILMTMRRMKSPSIIMARRLAGYGSPRPMTVLIHVNMWLEG